MTDKVFNKVIWHPWVIALYYVLFPYIINLEHLLPSAIIKPLLVVLLGTGLLFSILFFIFKDYRFSSILTSIFMILFFSYPPLYLVIQALISRIVDRDHSFDTTLLISKFWIVLSYVVIFALLVMVWRKSSKINRILTIALNCASILLVVISLGYGLPKLADIKSLPGFKDSWDKRVVADTGVPNPTNSAKRDIYLLVVDGYASKEVLEQIYGYDNSKFENELTDLGFRIIKNGRANYNQTRTSLSSLLNMKYLDDIAGQVGEETGNGNSFIYMIQNSIAVNKLRNDGYTIINFPSGYDYTEDIQADYDIKPDMYLNNFAQTLLWNSVAYPYLHQSLFGWRRDSIQYTLTGLAELETYPSPKFVFAHIYAPHPPFVFDKSGNPITPPYSMSAIDGDTLTKLTSGEYYRSHYADQLEYVSNQILETVKIIISKSEVKPIIIICGDHGPALTVPLSYTDRTNQYERMHLLNALYLPDIDSNVLLEDHTSVNTFRVIFDQYFGDDMPLLPNKSYISPYHRPYSFTDVTDEISSPTPMPNPSNE